MRELRQLRSFRAAVASIIDRAGVSEYRDLAQRLMEEIGIEKKTDQRQALVNRLAQIGAVIVEE